jgi:hypothetical protein
MKRLFAATVAASLSAVAADATTYNSRSSFQAVLGSPSTTITFSGLVGTPGYPTYTSNGYYSCSGYTLSGVTFDSNGVSPFCPTYIFDAPSVYALNHSSSGMFDQRGGVFKLNVPSKAFGFDFGSSSGVGGFTATVKFATASDLVVSLIVAAETNFVGFTGADEIVSVMLRDPASTAVYIKYDNVTFSNTVVGVPEPGTWGMMLFGFGGAGYAMRRRAKARENVSFARTQR